LRYASSAQRSRTARGWQPRSVAACNSPSFCAISRGDAVWQRLYLPRELLHAQGIYATMPSYVLAQPALPPVCDALAEQRPADGQ
jgi:hypothetical protein